MKAFTLTDKCLTFLLDYNSTASYFFSLSLRQTEERRNHFTEDQ